MTTRRSASGSTTYVNARFLLAADDEGNPEETVQCIGRRSVLRNGLICYEYEVIYLNGAHEGSLMFESAATMASAKLLPPKAEVGEDAACISNRRPSRVCRTDYARLAGHKKKNGRGEGAPTTEPGQQPQSSPTRLPSNSSLGRRRSPISSSQYLGVTFKAHQLFDGMWSASLIVKRKKIKLGSFDDEASAARAVDSYIVKAGLEKEFEINFPDTLAESEELSDSGSDESCVSDSEESEGSSSDGSNSGESEESEESEESSEESEESSEESEESDDSDDSNVSEESDNADSAFAPPPPPKTKRKKGASRRTLVKRPGKKSRGGHPRPGSIGAPQSAFRGVSWSPTAKKWQARLSTGQGKRKHVGFFLDDKKAAAAVEAEAKRRNVRETSSSSSSSSSDVRVRGLLGEVAAMQQAYEKQCAAKFAHGRRQRKKRGGGVADAMKSCPIRKGGSPLRKRKRSSSTTPSSLGKCSFSSPLSSTPTHTPPPPLLYPLL